MATETYYDCCDAEQLEHESPEDALMERFDDWCAGDMSHLRAAFAALCPIEVVEYRREVVADDWIIREATWLAERLSERFSEDYGDPDGYHDGFAEAVIVDAASKLVPWVKETVAHGTVWHCKRVGSRTYSAEEVEAMLRPYCPEWFEEAGQ